MQIEKKELLTITTEHFARFFLLHLEAEQKKNPSMIDSIRFNGKSAREINSGLIEAVKREFPGVKAQGNPAYNLFEEWFILNDFYYKYKEFAVEAYNLIFFERLVCLKNWSDESNEKFHKVTNEIFRKFDYRQDGFSVSNFLKFENNMRELMRKAFHELKNLRNEDFSASAWDFVWDIIYQQSVNYQAVVNEFFEAILKEAFEESERLLNNILPVRVSDELKKSGKTSPAYIPSATVLFTDFQGFTKFAENLEPKELIEELDQVFSIFDRITEKHNLEKIKTIGDSYMAAAGLPEANQTHYLDVALAALEMRRSFRQLKSSKEKEGKVYWDIRIGFHTGPIIAGVIGKKKFSYDIWGDTVNTASRMESAAPPGEINISEESHSLLKPFFIFQKRGLMLAKNKGKVKMYILKSIHPRYADPDNQDRAGPALIKIHQGLRDGKKR